MFSSIQSVLSKGIEALLPHQPSEPPREVPISESLLVAAHTGNLDAIKTLQPVLLELDKSPLDNEGNNCFMLCVASGSVPAVSAFLKEGAKTDVTNSNGCNLIHLSCISGSEEVLRMILKSSDARALLTEKTRSGGWSPIHICSAENRVECLELLLHEAEARTVLDAQDDGGNTAILIACCNGHTKIVQKLLAAGADLSLTNAKGETCLYLAARNNREEIVGILLGVPGGISTVNVEDIHRRTPVIAASGACAPKVVSMLLDAKANISQISADGTTALHAVCRIGRPGSDEVINLLIAGGVPTTCINGFGSTALHDACIHARVDAVRALLATPAGAELTTYKDYDGLSPLHSACNSLRNSSLNPEDCYGTIASVLAADGSDPNILDYTDANSLLLLVWGPNSPMSVKVAELLLDNGADPTLEYEQGWSALHVVCAGEDEASVTRGKYTDDLRALLMARCREKYPDYLAGFDPMKKRVVGQDAKYRNRAGAANRIPKETRDGVLGGDVSLPSFAAKLRHLIESGEKARVVFLTGAGISVSAGIPDFRSSSGIYSTQEGRDAFTLQALVADPKKFYDFVRKLFLPVFDGTTAPTAAHYFIKLMYEKGLVERIFTQNIDTLDTKAGVPSDLVVEAHGSFSSWRCTDSSACPVPNPDEVWSVIRAGGFPTCTKCGHVVRPDVVFFGEPLPKTFNQISSVELPSADFLIVMGTSLQVFPFAGLVNAVPLLCPRLLINRDPVGPWRDLESRRDTNYRDVAFVGDCDAGCIELAQLLGWGEDLRSLMNKSD